MSGTREFPITDRYGSGLSRHGTAISAQTLIGDFALLRNVAGLSQRACAHMFRHPFITKLFVRLFQVHLGTHSNEPQSG